MIDEIKIGKEYSSEIQFHFRNQFLRKGMARRYAFPNDDAPMAMFS